MLVLEETSIYYAVGLSLREISCVMYVHTLMCTCSCARANDMKIVRSRDAQCNTEESP